MILNRYLIFISIFTLITILTFTMILNRIRDYFDMDIKATRLNWYLFSKISKVKKD